MLCWWIRTPATAATAARSPPFLTIYPSRRPGKNRARCDAVSSTFRTRARLAGGPAHSGFGGKSPWTRKSSTRQSRHRQPSVLCRGAALSRASRECCAPAGRDCSIEMFLAHIAPCGNSLHQQSPSGSHLIAVPHRPQRVFIGSDYPPRPWRGRCDPRCSPNIQLPSLKADVLADLWQT